MPSSSINVSGGVLTPHTAFGSGRGGDFFPSPWLDQATLSMPDHNKNALEWCEYIWTACGTYRQARERVISYFLTDVEFGSADPEKPLGDDEKEQWEHLSAETLSLLQVIKELDRDRDCYGNGFASFVVPFKRFLVCPKSKHQFTFSEMADNRGTFNLEYDAGKNQFVATCPETKWRGAWKINDQPDDLERKLRLKIWSPHEIEIISDPWTGDSAYIWKIPDDYKRELRRGNMWQLERAPTQVLKAVHDNGVFLFSPDSMFHMKEPTLGGIRSRGWGISRTLTSFRDIWYVQVLRRYNEAIALDYIIPFRVITPEVRGSGGLAGGDTSDPLRMVNGGDFRSQVHQMLRKRRRDPATWHMLPFPIKYQALGGDATELAPHELLEQGYDIMLNSAGTPTDLYRGTLQLQTAPVSLRLFEATHHHLVHDNNRFLTWAVNQVNQLMGLSVVQAKMKRVTIADDFNKQMMMMQLMMGQTVSQTSGLKAIGMDYKDEQRQIGEEARYQQQLQAKIQEEMEQSAFGEQIAKGQGGPGMPPGGAPMDPTGGAGGAPMDPAAGGAAGPVTGMVMDSNTPVTPQDMMAQAESLAQQLLGLPESQKDSELRMLKQKNEILHSLVKAKMESIRGQAQLAGGSMLLGQQPAAPMA